MIAFDTDILTEILLGNRAFVERAATISGHDQAVPVIVIEEMIRGRLHTIRQAEAGKSMIGIERAYELFEGAFSDFRRVQVLSYTASADSLYQQWRQHGIRISTHDLRIAAICVAHAATLVSRNRRDFDRVPGLTIVYWE